MARKRKKETDQHDFAERHYIDDEEETARAMSRVPPNVARRITRMNAIASDPFDFPAIIERAQKRCAELDPHRPDVAKSWHILDLLEQRILELETKRVSKKEARRIREENEEFCSDEYAALITYEVAALASERLSGREDAELIDAINRRIGAYSALWELLPHRRPSSAMRRQTAGLKKRSGNINRKLKAAPRHARIRAALKKVLKRNPSLSGDGLIEAVRRQIWRDAEEKVLQRDSTLSGDDLQKQIKKELGVAEDDLDRHKGYPRGYGKTTINEVREKMRLDG